MQPPYFPPSETERARFPREGTHGERNKAAALEANSLVNNEIRNLRIIKFVCTRSVNGLIPHYIPCPWFEFISVSVTASMATGVISILTAGLCGFQNC